MAQTITLETPGRALIDITEKIAGVVERSGLRAGVAHIFIRHTSASLTIQENADPAVCDDLIAYFDRMAPESSVYAHAQEGPDDMPAHLKAALTAASLSIPFENGRLSLGVWQGVYVFEHRRRACRREIVISLTKEAA